MSAERLEVAARRVYRASCVLLPDSFRRRFAGEMVEMFVERMRESRRAGAAPALRLFLLEVLDVAAAGVRLRLESASGAVVALAMTASVATLLLVYGPATADAQRVEFRAQDPAGEFTLLIRDGRVARATIDGAALPRNRVVQAGDSIRLLAAGGAPLFSVAFDRDTRSIAWEARSPLCRGRAADCPQGRP